MSDRRCTATFTAGTKTLRCWLTARHDKTVWHQASDGSFKARWNNAGSYESETPTERNATR